MYDQSILVDQPAQVTAARELWLAQGGRLSIPFCGSLAKTLLLGARPRIHMHRHILVYVRSAFMSIISSFWIMLNYCSVGGALFFEFSNFRSKFRFFSNFQIQLVLQLDLDLDSARYTCRITNRRLRFRYLFFTGTGSRVPIQVVFSWSCTQLHSRLQWVFKVLQSTFRY